MSGCKDPGIWKNEMRLCAMLRKKYGDDFMLWVQPLEGKRFSSLVFYLSVLGKNYLSDQLVEFSKYKGVGQQQTKEIPLAPTTIGEDVKTTTFKPTTLKDFLKYGKDIERQRQEESSTDTDGANAGVSGSQ